MERQAVADAVGREAAFLNGGEMGARMRAHDWSRSPLGPLEAWPAPLRMAVSLMLNSAFPMFIAWGQELGFIYNDAYAEILGNKHPAALGCPFEVIWSEIWPDINPLIQRAMAGEATFSADLPLRMMRRGQYEDTWFTFSYSPVREEDGCVAGMFCCCVETTAGVRSQVELAELNIDLERQVAERSRERDRLWRNTQDIQVIIDGAGVFHAVNPAFTAILGWTPEDVIGRPVFDFVLPDDEALTSRALEHARVKSLPVVENRYRHKNGGFRWISWVAAPEAKLIYASGRHITAEKEQAEALSRTEEALRQAQKMEAVGQLTGGLAHDFNNLLAGISGSLELMQTRMQQGRLTDVDRYMTAAQGAAKRAAALTHRLLAFSRRQTLDPKPTDVSRLAMGMHELIQRTVGPGILVEVVGATGAWPALVDPPQLENALLNLCINARDAMPDGGTITIETANKWMDERAARQHDMPEGQYLSLAVTDTGTGMPPGVVARAFDPFFTTKPIGEGTGLGLSMIYGFAQQSGGQVRIYSEVGQGTTVCIYLPRFYGAIEDEAAAEGISDLPRSEQGETVLVVDDEPTVRMLITDILEDLGYAAIEAGDSATGLKVLQSDVRIDLLVTDVGLPGGMNGRQMADAARNHRPDLRVLFITGYAENAILGNGTLPPGMAVLTKPFAMDNMAARIRSMIEAGRETRLQRRS
jgi:PAS domain S-box-containing protein